MANTIEVDSHVIELSSLEKVLFPDDGIRKGDLVDYYQRIGSTMVPYMKGRPVTMHRFPNGIAEKGFYQKEAPDYFPGWIRRVEVEVEEEGSVQPQIICDNVATLVYLANQACITPHIWLSQANKLDFPDKVIFDLDPPEGKFNLVRSAALAFREILEAIGLVPYVMTTGSKGLHVVAPLQPSTPFDTVREFARDLADLLARQEPERYTVELRKNQRKGRLFLDYLRNCYAQNSVTPYALRAKSGAPVATPLSWDEASDQRLHAQRYDMRNIFRRLGQKEDPWADMMQQAKPLAPAREALDQLKPEAST